MAIAARLAAHPRAILIGQALGFCVFIAAFFVPAVRDGGPLTTASNIFKGWECAKIALSANFQQDTFTSSGFLVAMSGWINPMVLAYLAFTLARRFTRARRILAIAILICMVATWVYFATEHLVPMIGHWMWIAGALMMLAAELAHTQPASRPF
jgi:hypothetical protein